jgi:hypothetical protein
MLSAASPAILEARAAMVLILGCDDRLGRRLFAKGSASDVLAGVKTRSGSKITARLPGFSRCFPFFYYINTSLFVNVRQ